jgi:hypothetical protein
LPKYSPKTIFISGLLVVLMVGVSLQIFFSWASSSKPKNYYKPQSNAGLSIGGFSNTASASQVNSYLTDISKLGFTWIRLDISWSSVQAQDAKKDKWSKYDSIVAAANRHHLKVLGILDYAPGWAAQPGCINRGGCAPNDPAQFATFAAQAVQHYKQSVQNWEIWNEENIEQFWSPSPSAEQYTAVLKQSYKSIKKVDLKATVILGGMASGNNPNKRQTPADAFLQQVYAAGAKGSFDAVAYHPYTYPRTPLDANTAWSKLATLHAIMKSNGDGNKQIWITEYGAPTNGPAGSDFVSEAAQAQMARDAFKAARSKTWIGPFFWHSYQDHSTSTSTKENFFGLRRADGSPKLAYYTWQQLLRK